MCEFQLVHGFVSCEMPLNRGREGQSPTMPQILAFVLASFF